MLQMTTKRTTIALDVAKHVEKDFGISMSAQTVRCALKKDSLHSQQKKEALLFDKSVKRHLEFAKVHKY